MKDLLFLIAFSIFSLTLFAQKPSQTIKGTVIDQNSKIPVSFATVQILNTNPKLGTTTDIQGNFKIENVHIGRHEIKASYIGYESIIEKEITVTSAKMTVLNLTMQESAYSLGEITIKPKLNKEKALNNTTSVSSRMLSVEEAKRYAGGFDDPARLASSFAGVASGVSSNGIIVRGNSPKALQWKLEGIEIPNPNHFADLQGLGGGALTTLSTQALANSDFLTGALPAEYNNALSGVFDIFMKKGNNEKHEHTFQLGVTGIDIASEGPFKKGKKSSYLFNYRYSTLGLVSVILPKEDLGGFSYQDLSFKLNFPTKKLGTFSVWGLGLIDRAKIDPKIDSTKWQYYGDKEEYDAIQYMGASGINHKLILNRKSVLKTSLAATVNGVDWTIKELDNQMELKPKNEIQSTNWNFVLKSSLNTRINSKHTNKTGISATGLQYNILFKNKNNINELVPITDETGFSTLLSAYSNSTYKFSNKLTMNLGLNTQFFTLNNNFTIEPRLGFKWQWRENHQFGFGYGLHSRLERINYFFIKDPVTNQLINKNMDFTKSHHFVLNYTHKISENMSLKIEPYFQYLFDVPIIANSSFSFINLQNDWFLNNQFENTGNGRNYGIDITFEKYLTKGYYFMVTASVFNSEYRAGDGIWRNTRYNKNYLINVLGGKEWNLGKTKQNILSLNARLTFQGGDRYTPSNLNESIISENVIFDESKAFSEQIKPSFLVHFTASYKINKKKVSHEFALKLINATNYGDLTGFKYNFKNKTVDEDREAIRVPNLSYKIEF